jgi:hypothetical protein
MIRTQIQLTEAQAEQLREMAGRLGVSAAEVVRRLVEQAGSSAVSQPEEERQARALSIIGKFSSGRDDVSVEHDRFLAEAFTE